MTKQEQRAIILDRLAELKERTEDWAYYGYFNAYYLYTAIYKAFEVKTCYGVEHGSWGTCYLPTSEQRRKANLTYEHLAEQGYIKLSRNKGCFEILKTK